MAAIVGSRVESFSLAKESLMEVLSVIYNPDRSEAVKEIYKQELIKRISAVPTLQKTFKARILEHQPILEQHKFNREYLSVVPDHILDEVNSKPKERLTRFLKLSRLLEKGSEPMEDTAIIDRVVTLMHIEKKFMTSLILFCKLYRLSFEITWDFYQLLPISSDSISIRDTGELYTSYNLIELLDPESQFAIQILFEADCVTQDNELVNFPGSKRILNKLVSSSNLELRRLARFLLIHEKIGFTLSDCLEAHRAIHQLYKMAIDALLDSQIKRMAISADLFVLATPRLATLMKRYNDFYHEYVYSRTQVNQGINRYWCGESTINKIRMLVSSLSDLQMNQSKFNQEFIAYSIKGIERIKKKSRGEVSSAAIKFLLRLKRAQEMLGDLPSNRTKLLETPHLPRPKKTRKISKPKGKPVKGPAAPAAPESPPLSKESKGEGEVDFIPLKKGSLIDFEDAATSSDDEFDSVNEKKKEIQEEILSPVKGIARDRPAAPPLPNVAVPLSPDDSLKNLTNQWKLMRDFTYHERVTRWNFKFDLSMDRIPFPEYANSRDVPLKSYVRHVLTPEIDELIYDRNFYFKEASNEREHIHLMARIKYTNGEGSVESEDGIITYAFIRKGRKKVCIHRHFSTHSRGEIISAHKKKLFAHINSTVSEIPISELETVSTETPFAFETTRSIPDETLGYTNFGIPKLGVNIFVFRHTI